MSQEAKHRRRNGENYNGAREGVRRVLLQGIFWRILIIEGILLVWSLAYRIFTDPHAGTADLFWYAIRIVILIGVVILFVWLTFRRFLTRKIIVPLEAVSEANRRFREEEDPDVELPPHTPHRSTHRQTRKT